MKRAVGPDGPGDVADDDDLSLSQGFVFSDDLDGDPQIFARPAQGLLDVDVPLFGHGIGTRLSKGGYIPLETNIPVHKGIIRAKRHLVSKNLPPQKSYRFVLPWDEKLSDLDLHLIKDDTLHIFCRRMRSIPDLSYKQSFEDGARLRIAEDPKRFMKPMRGGRFMRRIQMAEVVVFAGKWWASARHGMRYFTFVLRQVLSRKVTSFSFPWVPK